MLGCEWFTIVRMHQQSLAIDDVFDRQVGGVAAVAKSHYKSAGSCDTCIFKECIYRDAAPVGIELRPLGNTVEIGVQLGLRECI